MIKTEVVDELTWCGLVMRR